MARSAPSAPPLAVGWNQRPPVIDTIPADRRIWFVSDLHLGDATPSDVFFGKDRHLLALVERVNREGSVLVIVGDAIDFHQAWSLTRVLRAHQELFAALSRLARDGRLYYVIGNHDYELNLFHDILQFRVCDELHVGDKILVIHGWQLDPYLRDAIQSHQLSTTVHHAIERYLGTWLRIPLGEFYTKGNRLMFWLAHKVALVADLWASSMALIGQTRSAESLNQYLTYWARSNLGDPMGIFRPAWDILERGGYDTVLCGHSHLPGVVRRGGKTYVNTGSWTFASSHYVVWDGAGGWSCRDWITGARFGQELYEPLLDGAVYEKDFWQWWRENYMGLFRFREGEERKRRLRGWESYVRDYQHLSQLSPLRVEPLPREISDEVPSMPAADATEEDVLPPEPVRSRWPSILANLARPRPEAK
jgi:UDP-2,3-diacylglucosamine pyrophosphatase LpxH